MPRNETYFFCEEQTLYGSARLGTEQVEHSMRGLVTNDALTDEITRAREQHGDNWQQRLDEQYEGRFYERLQEAWGNEWNTRLDFVLQGNNDGWLIEQIRNESYTLQVGNKRYELSNHLGNVLAVVSDKKVQTDGAVWSAVVVSAQDYYPFGMTMPGRSTTSTYKYGFNGQEKDTEIGAGIYTAEFWEYDARLGRRMNLDPVDFAWESPYATFHNNPISFSDPNGDTPGGNPECTDCANTAPIPIREVEVTAKRLDPSKKPQSSAMFGKVDTKTVDRLVAGAKQLWQDLNVKGAVITSAAAVDAFISDLVLKPEPFHHPDFYGKNNAAAVKKGHFIGHTLALAQGVGEVSGGHGAAAAGGTLTLSVVGAEVGIPLAGVGVATALHGAAVTGVATANLVRMGIDEVNDQAHGSDGANHEDGSERDWKKDKKLSDGEIKKLKEAGEDIHELKGGAGPAAHYDLYKDKKGNIYQKRKGGKGAGEGLGININDY